VPPPSSEARDEGPFGEWPGYYSGGTAGTGEKQPIIRVKAVCYRNDPILMNMAPQWPGAPVGGLTFAKIKKHFCI
jgi:UbiD family decarboxylase